MPSRSRRSGPPGRTREEAIPDNPRNLPSPRAALNAWGKLGPREERWQAVGWSIGATLVVMAIVFVAYYGITLALAAIFDLDPTSFSYLTYILVMAPLLALGSWLLARGAGQGRRELGLVAGPPGRILAWGSVGGLLGLASNYGLLMLLYLVVLLVSGRHLTSPDGEAIRSLGHFYQVIAIAATCIFAPICEELFFRGALYSAMRKSLSRNRALILNALVFALLHLKWQGLPSLFALGLIFAYLYEETGSVYPGMIAHAINNIVVLSLIYLT